MAATASHFAIPERGALWFPPGTLAASCGKGLAGRPDLPLCPSRPSGGYGTISVSEGWCAGDFFSVHFYSSVFSHALLLLLLKRWGMAGKGVRAFTGCHVAADLDSASWGEGRVPGISVFLSLPAGQG